MLPTPAGLRSPRCERGRAVFAVVARRVLGLLIFVASTAAEQVVPPDPPKNVKVTVVCILAAEQPEYVAPELIHVAKEVQKKDPKLKCFKLKCMSCKSLAVNQPYTFKLLDQQEVQVVIKQAADK